MEIISNTALISINETLIVQVLSFLVFLFVIDRLMFRPLNKTIGDRDRYFQEISGDIEKAKNDLERITSEVEDRKAAVRSEANRISRELGAAGKEAAGEIAETSRREVSDLKESAKQDIDAQIAEAKINVRKESEGLAVNIMEKVLERRLAQ